MDVREQHPIIFPLMFTKSSAICSLLSSTLSMNLLYYLLYFSILGFPLDFLNRLNLFAGIYYQFTYFLLTLFFCGGFIVSFTF